MVRGRARGGKGSLCPPPPNTPNRPTWIPPPHHHPELPHLDPPPTDPPGAPPPPAPPIPPLRCPPPRGLRPTVSWGGSWRPEPRGRPPRGLRPTHGTFPCLGNVSIPNLLWPTTSHPVVDAIGGQIHMFGVQICCILVWLQPVNILQPHKRHKPLSSFGGVGVLTTFIVVHLKAQR